MRLLDGARRERIRALARACRSDLGALHGRLQTRHYKRAAIFRAFAARALYLHSPNFSVSKF